jgi:hypothetical protein
MKNAASFAVIVSFALIALADCAHAQTPRYIGVSPFPPGPYISVPGPPIVIGPEERITTMIQAEHVVREQWYEQAYEQCLKGYAPLDRPCVKGHD